MFQVKNVYLVLIGIFLGALLFFYPVFLLYFFLLGILLFFLLKVDSKDRSILIKIVCIGLVLRICVSLLCILIIASANVDVSDSSFIRVIASNFGGLWRDLTRDIENGLNLASYFRGEYGDVSLGGIGGIVASEGVTNYLNMSSYLLGFLNYFFGNSFLNLLLIPLIGIWTVVFTYFAAKDIFDRKVALISSFIIALTPSLIGWAAINIRTSLVIISFLLGMWFISKFSKKNHFGFLLPIFASISLVHLCDKGWKFLNLYLFIVMLLLFLSLHLRTFLKIIFLIITYFIGVIFFSSFQSKLTDLKNNVVMLHHGSVEVSKNYASIKLFPDEQFYQGPVDAKRVSWDMMIPAISKGVAYFLFSPFLWDMNSPRQLLAYVQNLFWYFLFPFCIWGIFISLCFYHPKSYLVLVFCLFWILGLSLTMGNIGTMFRQRDLIFPFLFMFSVVGVRHFLMFLDKKFLISIPNKKAIFS